MSTEPHPDELQAYHATRQITRGGNQAADDVAMEAMWRALESGKSKGEAETIFSETYQKVVNNGANRSTMEGN